MYGGTIPEEPKEGEDALWRWNGEWREIIPGWALPQQHALDGLAQWAAIYEPARERVTLLHPRGSWTEIDIGFWCQITKEEGKKIAERLQEKLAPGRFNILITHTPDGIDVQIEPFFDPLFPSQWQWDG